MNNNEFVEGLQNQDPAAAAHLHECVVPTVWRMVYVSVDRDCHLAEDIVSESVLALISAIQQGIEIEYPIAWLRRVAKRRIQDHFRAAARVAHLMEQPENTVPNGVVSGHTTLTAQAQHDAKLRQIEIRNILDQMPEEYRLVLEWKYVDNLSVSVIAERLATTEKAAESILFRARKTFRDQVGWTDLASERHRSERHRNKPPQSTESQSTESQSTECQSTESQSTESQSTESRVHRIRVHRIRVHRFGFRRLRSHQSHGARHGPQATAERSDANTAMNQTPFQPDPNESAERNVSADWRDEAIDDGVLESQLCDRLSERLSEAMDAPPVPSTLTRKINQGLQATRGIEMFDVDHDGRDWRGSVATGAARLQGIQRRVWPLVAALAGTVVLAMFLFSGSTGYAWATMLDAIALRPAVQIGDDAERQAALPSQAKTGSDRERTQRFVQLLMRQAAPDRDITLDGFSVRRQSWRRNGEDVLLNVTLENTRDQIVELQLALDPETSLPRRVRVMDEPTQSSSKIATPGRASFVDLAISYPTRLGLPDEPRLPNDPVALVSASLPLGETPKWRSVAVARRTPAEVRSQIDSILARVWSENEIDPVARASEAELLRRVYLDLAGRTPTVTEVRHYLQDTDPDRYQALVNRLVGSSDHASHLATTWRTFLIPEGVDLTAFGGREAFDRWLAERFESGEPYDAIVRQLLLAEGRLSKSGPLLFYSAAKLDPDRLAGQTSRVFLGIRLECAQCHDHPFEPWTQEDFWSYAAFFARISRPQAELESVSTVMQVRDVDRGDVMLPETETVVPPRFLGESFADGAEGPGEATARRQRLAKWLTSGENPYFARATVNRIWSLMFGRGIVDPVDDFGSVHLPISAELLDTLASQLIDSGFDLRAVTRTVALSQAYQLSSAAPDMTGDMTGEDAADEAENIALRRLKHFGQMELKTLTAGQLYDCITVATLLDQSGGTNTSFQLNRFGNSSREAFVQQFASPAGNRVEYMSGIPQALTLMNGGLIDSATEVSSSGLLKSLDAPFFTNDQRIEVLFLATLSRSPSPSEWTMLRDAVAKDASSADRREVLADVLWALLNSAEFSLNH